MPLAYNWLNRKNLQHISQSQVDSPKIQIILYGKHEVIEDFSSLQENDSSFMVKMHWLHMLNSTSQNQLYQKRHHPVMYQRQFFNIRKMKIQRSNWQSVLAWPVLYENFGQISQKQLVVICLVTLLYWKLDYNVSKNDELNITQLIESISVNDEEAVRKRDLFLETHRNNPEVLSRIKEIYLNMLLIKRCRF